MVLAAADSLRKGMISVGGADLSGVIVHHDKDSVYTSYAWLKRLLLEERVRLSCRKRRRAIRLLQPRTQTLGARLPGTAWSSVGSDIRRG
jgi:hypothetical protein